MCKEALKRAVGFANGPGRLASAVRSLVPGSKISRAHIYKWLNRTEIEVPPAEYVIPICAAIGWVIVPHELRADIYPNRGDAIPDAFADTEVSIHEKSVSADRA